MIIKRLAESQIKQKIQPGKVIVLYGPRRVGKTFLLHKIEENLKNQEQILFLNGESRIVQDQLSVSIPENLKNYLGKTSLLIIDEAQKIPEVGSSLKLLVDSLPNLKIIASGSASFSLSQKVGEPLTGRKKTIHLYPVSARELILNNNHNFYLSIFESHLILGGYPEIFSLSSLKEQEKYLLEIVDSYLLKDILEMESIRSPKKIRDLLTLLAFQIGNEVSLTELGQSLDLHKDTVCRYLDLLEKSFVIINIRGFSRNLRNEVTKNSRWYFCDNGIRNALINNFNPPHLRNDMGMLWENYLVVERLKKQSYEEILSHNYFWRTYTQKELDWVEERQGKLFGYEFKWGDKKKKLPKDWLESYPGASYQLINQLNFLKFI